jgi:Protein of unknown function (DUF2510)
MVDDAGAEAPGWYADPTRRHEHRYWDGTQWADQVSDHGVTATDAEAPSGLEARPAAALATDQVVLTIGDIGVTRTLVVTPNGTAPLKGSQWIARDATRQEEKIPGYAIVLAIVFALACLIGLLFLLIKEKRTVGYVEVTVTSGNLMYMTQLSAAGPTAVAQVRQLVAQAQSMAAAAS